MKKGMRSLLWLGLAGIAGISSCAEERPPISNVETGVVDKNIFDGAWYTHTVVIDVDYEGASLSFEGDSAYDYSGGIFTLPRVRWVIEKDYLLAYRDYELIQGTDRHRPEFEENPDEFIGEPVAAFPIDSHFDIRRDYNATTGEEQNVLVENDTDKRWWERRFMRVDWSTNEADSFRLITADLYEMFGYYTRESVTFDIAEGDSFPDDWKPVFRTMTCNGWDDEDCDPQDRDHAGDYEKGDLYFMSFVTQVMLTPGLVPDPFGRGLVPWCLSVYGDAPVCTTNLVTMRHSFLKKSERRQYEALDYPDGPRFDRFGLFRLEQPVIDRQMGSPSDPTRGTTDARNYAAIRHNLWRQWWEVNEDGTRGPDIPLPEREVRPIIFYMTKDMPYHLIRTSFEVASDWNVPFMKMVREIRGEPIPGSYDPYSPPTGDGYDCWIHTRDGRPARDMEPTFASSQAEEDANGPVYDSDFAGWTDVVMDGSECVVIGRVNSCIANPDDAMTPEDESLPCEGRGDLRYKFISYVSQPGTPFLGVSTLRGDPITGEYMAGDGNIGGPALDSYRTRTLLWHDLANGRLTPESIIAGEDVREYFEAVGRVDWPVIPLRDFRVASNVSLPGFDEESIRSKFEGAFDRALANGLHGPDAAANLFDERLSMLRGTTMEDQLVNNDETLAANGFWDIPAGAVPSEALLESISFARTSPTEMIARDRERQRFYDERTMEFAGPGFDWAMLRYAMDNKDLPRSQVVYNINRALYKGTQSHELGHCFALRHNFAASADIANYVDEYYALDAAHPLPVADDFDDDGDGLLDAEEEAEYRDAWVTAKRDRDGSLIASYMSNSTMDYSSDWYEDLEAMGKWDRAVVYFTYGDLVEVRDNPSGLAPDNPELHATPPTAMWRFYAGGEPCDSDSDCPMADDPLARPGQTRQSCIPSDVTGVEGASGVCSNFYGDMHARMAGGDDSVLPVEYKFCTDDRVGSLPDCHRFDKGASFQEVIANQRERYHRDYIFNNFRRFRSGYGVWGGYGQRIIGRIFQIPVDIFQNMFHRYTYEEGYADDRGPFGFYDQYLAAAAAMNFFMEIIAQPQPGGYTYNRIINEFTRTESYPDVLDQDLNIYLGQGKYMYSVYQGGLTGIRRVERLGVFYDKVWSLQMMMLRDWGWRYSLDQRWMVNFYDLFPDEMTQFLSGAIRDFPQDYAARVQCETFDDLGRCGNPRIVYMDHHRGAECHIDADGNGIPDGVETGACRPPPHEVYAGIPTIDSASSFLLQLYAPMLALALIPSWYDTTFRNQLNICILGTGDCAPPVDVDGEPEVECEPFTECEDADYVMFTSDRYHATWLARNTERGLRDVQGASISFDMVKEAAELQQTYVALSEAQDEGRVVPPFRDAGEMANEIRRVRRRRDRLEDFGMWILDLQRSYGINLYL